MKKTLLFMFGVCLILGFTACSSTTSGEAQYTDDGRLIVTFWHAMGGNLGETLQKIADDFNASQDEFYVQPEYQGTYEESLNKLRQVGGTPEAPTLMQVFEVGTKYMAESGYIVPMQTFIDQDQFDISNLEENILGYYQIDGQLYSMPFNTSNAIMLYNKDMFREAGLDPEDPPSTFSEVQEVAQRLTQGAETHVDVHGFGLLIHGWFFEQLLANQGAYYVDQDNGRSGEPTRTLINEQPGLNVFTWLDEMNKEGTLGIYGRDWDDIRAAFKAEKLAMYLDSTAGTASNVNDSDFEVGTAYLPVMDGQDRHGVIIGGASLWMMEGKSEEEQLAAWEFIKYLVEPETQAYWAGETGYFPITKAAHEEATLQEVYDTYPQFLTAVEQLQNTTLTPATQGALMSVFPQAREHVMTAIEKLYDGASPEEALNEAAEMIDRALEDAKRTR
ncbi:ABC transporter substrate-binding protein [Caldalkalibacillus salinus]|uniref:ABC transporter substrate-binding protein n=1 Tax=Caldalkalibacillus salinus TaxID=2803787 RepID=UPI001921243D|nr:ABC transporter substrate-binding protein [Caldalkalibacillus salinus]